MRKLTLYFTQQTYSTSIVTCLSPVFCLVLELLLLMPTFLFFFTRWYLSASILSDPAEPLGAPRRFLCGKQREAKPSHRGRVVRWLAMCVKLLTLVITWPCCVTVASAGQQATTINHESLTLKWSAPGMVQFSMKNMMQKNAYLSGKRDILRVYGVSCPK